jgi:hypothetical protein
VPHGRSRRPISAADRIDHSKRHPAYIAYQVRDGKDGGEGRWTEIGVAWATENGNGFVLHLNFVPIDGQVVMVPPDKDR